MEYQHSKKVLRPFSFMKHLCNETGSNEEQNPLAVMKLAKLKSWLAKEFSCLNTQNISPPIYQELIYRSPEQCQKMVVARYSVQLQLENRNTVYQGCSRSQMLIWDDCVPPPRRDPGGGGWYIVSMEVTVDKIDQGGQSPDNRNPELYLKVSLNVIRDRTTWPSIDFSPCDAHLQTNTYTYNNVLDPSFLTLHEGNTMNPKELDQLIKSIWLGKYMLLNEQPKDFMPKDTQSIVPAKHVNHWNLNTSRTSDKLLPSSNWKTDFKEKLAEVTRPLPEQPELSCGAMHADPQNLDAIGKLNKVLPSPYCKSVLILNFLNHVHSIVPKLCLFNTGAKYEDHQKQNTNGKSERIATGNRAIPGFGSVCCILLLFAKLPAASASLDHQVKFEISHDSDDKLYCSLETEEYFTSYGNYEQNKEQHKNVFNETVQKLVEEQCQQKKKPMETNLWSLIRKSKVNSGKLWFVVTWTLDESYKMTNVTVPYIFNNRSLTNEEIINLPFPISDGQDNTNLSDAEYLKKIKDQGTVLWESFRPEIIPYLIKGDVSESADLLLSKSLIKTGIVIFLIVIGLILCLTFYGKKICTKVNETFSKVRYRAPDRTEADVEGDSNVEAPKGEDHVAIPVQ